MDYGLETWIPVIVTLGILVWGLRLLSSILMSPNLQTVKPMMATALTEKKGDADSISFSRVSGAIGSVGLAAFMSGLGLWVFFALNSADATLLTRMLNLKWYLLGSSSLFAPYALNQLNGLFGTK